ncbi:DUF6297 family protein [Propioniciclava soli]|uniref:DUF6297 family protein n=1 Tax=Propioniciclava soli TaxID=2775081 RepID=A0ABZ3C9V1_9ACTN
MSKKQRKRSASTVAEAAPVATEPEETVADHAGRDWNFAFLPDAEPEWVDEAALHGLMKDWRHGRATRTIGQVLSDAYFAVFTIVLLGAMIVNAIVGSQHAAASCTTADCAVGRTLIPWGVYFALCALTLGVARLFGPVLASAAEGFWLMEAPIGRARLLRPRLWGVIVLAGLLTAALQAVVAALAGEPGHLVAAFAAATGLSCAGLMAWAAAAQSGDRRRPLALVRAVAALGAVVALTAMVAVSAGWVAAGRFAVPDAAVWVLAGAGALLALGCGTLAHRRLDVIPRARLTSGGSLVSSMQGAMFALDFGLARDILVEREAAARGHVRPTRGRGTEVFALVWRDVQRLARFPRPLFGVLGAALVPYALDAIGLGLASPLLGAIALMVALIPLFGALRVLSRTSGLARTLPFSTRQIRLATSVVPALLAAVWCALVTPSMAGILGGVARAPLEASLAALATAAAGLLGAMRWQTARPVDFQVPMLATSSGAVPPTLIFNLLRGFDMVALVTAPLLLDVAPVWAVALAAVVAGFLTAGINTAEMTEEAAEQRAALEEERNRAKGKASRPAARPGGGPAGSTPRPRPTGATAAGQRRATARRK